MPQIANTSRPGATWASIACLTAATLPGLPGCGTVGEQYNLTEERGFAPSPITETEIGLGTSTELRAGFCWDQNTQSYMTVPQYVAIYNARPSQVFYEITAGTGTLLGGIGVLKLGIDGVDGSSSSATANSSSSSSSGGPPIVAPPPF